MKKVYLALFLSATAFAGVVNAQERPPANTVVESTDPDAIAQAEQHARDAQSSAEAAPQKDWMAPEHHKDTMMHHHHPHHKPKHADGASGASGAMGDMKMQ